MENTVPKEYHEWLRKGLFIKNGITYRRGYNDHQAVLAMIPESKKVTGKICFIGDLTLLNADLNSTYHKGFTVGSGKVLYWEMIWHSKSGNVTVYNKSAKRYLSGDQEITIHFK